MDKAVYFKSPGCAVCHDLYPKIKAHFDREYPQLDFEVVAIDKSPELAAEHGVFTVPVLLIFFEGKEHLRFIRNFSTASVDEKLKRTYALRFD